jgi:hypothetical protein
VQRHDPVGLHPEVGVAVAVRHALAPDLEQVPETGGGEEAEPRHLALEERIGGHGRAVEDGRYARPGPAGRRQALLGTGEKGR